MSIDQNIFNQDDIGLNQVTLTVVDNAGIISGCTSTINVIASGLNMPVAVCSDITVYLDENGVVSITDVKKNC